MPSATKDMINAVRDVCAAHGHNSIIVLSGVAGTGKSHVAKAAAVEVAGHPAFVREVQFHPSYTYEDFVEGWRPTGEGGFEPRPGVCLEWSRKASVDESNTYVLLVEELSRAPLTTVLGELMTYIEYRGGAFTLPASGATETLAPNLVILATMNPRDRSALEVDDALIRRLRIVDCPPSVPQLVEMLDESLVDRSVAGEAIVEGLKGLFEQCEAQHPDTYDIEMPFGHGMFAGVRNAEDLHDLWHQRIKHILRRPLVMPHPFTETITGLYPWRDRAYVEATS